MKKPVSTAQAGTLESNDISIIVSPGEPHKGIVIDLESVVFDQFGQLIFEEIRKTVEDQGVTDVYIKANDRGALNCTVTARTLTALARAGVVLKEDVL
ncbi:MAG: citrate lyase acyl carrier protein [Negativicutes bacterium]